MDTENIVTTAETTETTDAFDEGWDMDYGGYQPDYTETEEDAEQEETSTEEQPEDQRQQDEPEDTDAEDTPTEATKQQEQTAEPKDESFTLKYMDTFRTVGRDEMTALAQKGLDYDRIRGERDTLKTENAELNAHKDEFTLYRGFLDEMARDAGTDIQGLMDMVRARAIVNREQAQGREMNFDLALERVKLNRERQEFEAAKQKPTQQNENPQEAENNKEPETPEQDTDAARKRDNFVAFAEAYPEVKASDIPQEVWDEFSKGETLTNAYAKWENKQLKEKLRNAENQIKNRERSTGSRATGGAGRTKDAFDEGWDMV